MDWVDKAKNLFQTEKPEHFTDYNHCPECYEHNETLRAHDIKTITIKELGNPGWDPLCFSSIEGIKYYMPALIRLSLDTINDDYYFEQFLFHLTYEGNENRILVSCTDAQKQYIYDFLTFILENHCEGFHVNIIADDLLEAATLWKP